MDSYHEFRQTLYCNKAEFSTFSAEETNTVVTSLIPSVLGHWKLKNENLIKTSYFSLILMISKEIFIFF